MKKSLILAGMLCIGYASAQEERVGINTETPSATLNVKTKTDAKSAKNLELENQAGTKLMTVLNNGNVGIGTDTPAEKLSVLGGRIAVSGDGTLTGYLEDVHLKFNRPQDAYVSNLNEKGRLNIQTGGNNVRMTFWENGRISAGTNTSPTFFTIKGLSNYGIMRVVSNDENTESGIGYQIFGNPSEVSWVTGINPRLGDGNSFMIAKGGTPRLFIKDKNVGIGTISPENSLHIKADANPLKLEGLQASTVATDKILVAGTDGVVKTIERSSLASTPASIDAVQVGSTTSMACDEANRGKMNFVKDVTLAGGGKADAFAVCLKGSDGKHYWRYLYGAGGETNGSGNFGAGL